jgi:NTE family protein
VTDWAGLPRPIAFVLSGGASLGAIQVGMLQALADVGLQPDLVVGTSVGSLNGAVVAEHQELGDAATALEDAWRRLRRREVLPNGPIAQALSALRTGYLQEQRGLRRVIMRSLRTRRFEELVRPLTIVTADVLTSHVRWFGSGPLVPPLLAATAIPGVFPPVLLDERLHWDAGAIANVPMQAALGRGAASLVVLDAGDVCHLDAPPRGIPHALLGSATTAMRQRALIEAPLVAEQVPLLYLPRPCAENRSLLDLDTSADLVGPTRAVVSAFLGRAELPRIGQLSGAPHHHDEDLTSLWGAVSSLPTRSHRGPDGRFPSTTDPSSIGSPRTRRRGARR